MTNKLTEDMNISGEIFANNIITKLSTTTGISLTATGATSLYTVPASKSAIITEIILLITSVTGFVTVATVRAGLSPAYTEFSAATALTGLSTSGYYIPLSSTSLLPVRKNLLTTEVLSLDVTVAAVATTFVVSAIVFGYEY